MIYVISDIHGRMDKYQDLLRTLNFGPEDTLYVLGDIIDRGPDGFKMMLDIARRPNIITLLGNHEAMAMDALSRLMDTPLDTQNLDQNTIDAMDLWFYNGGGPSLDDFLLLDTDQAQIVWDYMQRMPLYKEITVNNQQFLLVHGGLEHFSPSRPLEDYQPDEILWCRPNMNLPYYPDKYVIFGHTPVQLLHSQGADAPAKIYHWGKSIDIDCGCVFPGGQLGCLCLDTMDEIYV